jgi:alcohol dehydrogenase
MKIRAAVLTEMGLPPPYATSRPLRIETVDLADPGPGEVLVRIRAAGLCHSDLSVIDGNRPRPLPMVIGHEVSGVVEGLGAEVAGLREGDHVVAAFVPSCGHCGPCAHGRPALCEPGFAANSAGTLLSGARRLSTSQQPLMHHLGVSGFADYAVLAQESLIRVDPVLPFEHAALFGCAVLTGVGAVLNTADPPPGASVAVVGLGGVGLAALMGAKLRQPRSLIAVDLNSDKLGLALRLGATQAIAADDPECAAKIRDATGGGVEFAFEMAGAVQALQLAYAITRRGGTTVTAGLAKPQATFSVPQLSIVAEERTIKGSYLGGGQPRRDIVKYVEWFQAGKLPVERLLSERIELDGLNAAFDRLASGVSVRQVVLF